MPTPRHALAATCTVPGNAWLTNPLTSPAHRPPRTFSARAPPGWLLVFASGQNFSAAPLQLPYLGGARASSLVYLYLYAQILISCGCLSPWHIAFTVRTSKGLDRTGESQRERVSSPHRDGAREAE